MTCLSLIEKVLFFASDRAISLKRLRLLYFGLLVLPLVYCNQALAITEAATHQDKLHPIVEQLETIIRTDPTLDKALKDMLMEAPKSNPWSSKSASDVYEYLNSFLKEPLLPGLPQRSFFELRNSDAGEKFFNHPVIRSWGEDFFRQIYVAMNSPSSRALIKKWQATPNINLNMQDFIVPKDGFKNFNDFFSRRLKPGVRPISSPGDDSVIVSPNDGFTELLIPQLRNKQDIMAKGDRLNIRDIFNNNPIAQKFIGGSVIEQHLGVTNYHHFHAPISGKVVYSDVLSGIRTADEQNWEKSTFNHDRGVYILHNPCVGYVGMVPVGFWMVGSIDLFKQAGDDITKGEEIGQFKLGSAMLLFFEHDRIKVNSRGSRPIKVGQQLAQTQLACGKNLE